MKNAYYYIYKCLYNKNTQLSIHNNQVMQMLLDKNVFYAIKVGKR